MEDKYKFTPPRYTNQAPIVKSHKVNYSIVEKSVFISFQRVEMSPRRGEKPRDILNTNLRMGGHTYCTASDKKT